MKHGAAWAIGFFGVLFFLSTAFAAYSALQTVGTASSGSQILSAEWNKMVSNFASVDSQLSSLSSSIASLGTLAMKSSVASADITDASIATNDLADSAVTSTKIANSAVTDAKVASGISPSKLAQASATNDQVLKWNGTAWAPGADSTGSFTVTEMTKLISSNCSWVTQTTTSTHQFCAYQEHDVYAGGCDSFSYVRKNANGTWTFGVYR